jgi:hypothetical protein
MVQGGEVLLKTGRTGYSSRAALAGSFHDHRRIGVGRDRVEYPQPVQLMMGMQHDFKAGEMPCQSIILTFPLRDHGQDVCGLQVNTS